MKRELLQNESKQIVGVRITPDKGRKDKKPFTIPIVDVRHGDKQRNRAVNMCKGVQSNFIKETFSLWGRSYRVSQK